MHRHGFAIFGDKTTYLSHLAMLAAPEHDAPEHRFQLLLRTSVFDGQGKEVRRRFIGPSPKQPLTAAPPGDWDLGDAAEATATQKFTLPVQLFVGIFDEGGKLYRPLPAVKLAMWRIWVDPLPQPHTSELRYLLFGTAKEAYLVHKIESAPDFDQILGVDLKAAPASFLPSDGTPVEVVIQGLTNDGRKDVPPLRVGKDYSAKLPGGKVVTLTVRTEYYFGFGDLAGNQ
jgi:hypothetical protein